MATSRRSNIMGSHGTDSISRQLPNRSNRNYTAHVRISIKNWTSLIRLVDV